MSAPSIPTRPDFIIVGGGTAGCVLANRLSEDPDTRVLVLESGKRMVSSPQIRDPNAWENLLESSADWHFKTIPQVTSKPDLTGHSKKLNMFS